MSNVVIMVWMKHLDAGFGDLLRGTIYLYKLSQQMKFTLIVDTQLHPVSQFLISHPHEFSNYVIQNKSKINISINPPDKYVVDQIRDHALSNNPNPILITTNCSDNHETPSVECKQFMRSMLLPNDEFKKYFNDMCNVFKIPKHYSIMHFRLGDYDLVQNKSNMAHYNKLFNIVNQHIATIPNLCIISDSVQFKQYLKRLIHPKFAGRIITTKSVHLSYPNNDIEVKETFFDFMLLTNAMIIKTHSVYGWISGFVQWASHIFNVPLVNLNLQQFHMNISSLGSKSNSTQPIYQQDQQGVQKRSQKQLIQSMKSMQPMQHHSMSSVMKTIRPAFGYKSKTQMAFSKMF